MLSGQASFGKIVQSVHKTSKVSVSEKTKCAGSFDRIVESLRRNIRLANKSDPAIGPPSNFPSIAASVTG